jgi:V8-like Glu-specific endopeptidase
MKFTTILKMITLLFILALVFTAKYAYADKLKDNTTMVYNGNPKHETYCNGVFINRYLILTAEHCIDDSPPAGPVVIANGKFIRGDIALKSQVADIALISIKGKGRGPRGIKVCNYAPKTGEEFRLGTIDSGSYIEKRGFLTYLYYYYFGTSVRVFDGNSGAPLVKNNCIIGILKSADPDDEESYYVSSFRILEFLARYNLMKKRGEL